MLKYRSKVPSYRSPANPIATFYALPTVHKKKTPITGRPIGWDNLTVTEHTILVSLDVEALYSNIQHQFFLKSKGIQFKTHNEFLLTLLEFTLTYNCFLFNGTFFHQLYGTAMGTVCAPTYANLCLGWWEHQTVFSANYIFYTSHILFWGHYIDDVLILWEGNKHIFEEFVSLHNHNSMRFTYKIQQKEIDFLDLKIMIDQIN